MLDTTKLIIESAVKGDSTLTAEDRSRIMKSLTSSAESKIQMITTREACTMLDCSRRTLYMWEKAGKIHAVRRTKRSLRYSYNDVLRLATEGAEQLSAGGK